MTARVAAGVDPPNAIAVVHGDTLLFLRSFSKSKNWKNLSRAIDEAMEAAMKFGPEVIAIERGWFPRPDSGGRFKRNPGSALVSSMKAGLWIQAWFDYGGKTEPILREPGKWRKMALGGGAGGHIRSVAKEECIQYMGLVYNTTFDDDDDKADAVGIARSVTFTT